MANQLLETIGIFYDCVGDDFRYEAALKAYSETAEDLLCALSEIKPLLGKVEVLGAYGGPIEAVEGFKPTKVVCPQWDALRRAVSTLPVHIPIMRRTIVSDKDWETSATYQRVSGPWGYHGDGASLIIKGLLKVITCGFARKPGQDELKPETLATMAMMNQHLSRALTMQNRISSVEQLLIQSRNILDLIEFGVVLYNAEQKPVFVNTSAQRIFDDADGLKISLNGLEAYDSKAQQALNQLISTTLHQGVSLSSRAGGMLKIPRKSIRKPYTLTIVPMQGSLLGDDTISAVTFIFDPVKKQTTTFDALADCYGFTPTETELAIGLMHGDSLEVTAKRRGVSYNTMKTHLHAIFAKTNTNRQVDLVSLLLRSVSGIKLVS